MSCLYYTSNEHKFNSWQMKLRRRVTRYKTEMHEVTNENHSILQNQGRQEQDERQTKNFFSQKSGGGRHLRLFEVRPPESEIKQFENIHVEANKLRRNNMLVVNSILKLLKEEPRETQHHTDHSLRGQHKKETNHSDHRQKTEWWHVRHELPDQKRELKNSHLFQWYRKEPDNQFSDQGYRRKEEQPNAKNKTIRINPLHNNILNIHQFVESTNTPSAYPWNKVPAIRSRKIYSEKKNREKVRECKGQVDAMQMTFCKEKY